MMITFLVYAMLFIILFVASLCVATISVAEKCYAYEIINEQEEIIREYEELIMKLEEGETQNGRNDSSDYYETARRT